MSNTNLGRHCGTCARLWCVSVIALAMLVTASVTAQSPERASAALTAFESQVQDYARMHRRLERPLGRIEIGTPVVEINRIITQLAAAIRAERGAARQGEFFAPAVVDVLRARITAALLEHQYAIEDLRAASRVDGVDYAQVRLKVNDTFPWILATAMFACVIEALPPLPPEMQYRIVGDDLLLVDIHASLIVDILPRALVGTDREFFPYASKSSWLPADSRAMAGGNAR